MRSLLAKLPLALGLLALALAGGAGGPPATAHSGDVAPAPAGSAVLSGTLSSDEIQNLTVVGRGSRLMPDATTDVWALDGFAYIGTFDPCGDGSGANGSGVRIFDVHNLMDGLDGPLPNTVPEVGFVPSVLDSRINDVKVANMSSGAILVHSNEPCAEGGPGGFEIYNVDDPTNPVHLAHMQTDDINPFLRAEFDVVDEGVHNLFPFSQGDRDYVAAVVESLFGTFQIFDITDPSSPSFAGFWGAEELAFPGVNFATLNDEDMIFDALDYLFDGSGTSANRFLHDITVSQDGSRAYLSSWDAGLVLLDISDPTDPTLISVAEPPDAGPGGEGNSHATWPNADGSIVVETTEDFEHERLAVTVVSGDLASSVFEGIEDVEGPPPPRFADVGVISPVEAVFVGQGCDTNNFNFGDAPGIFDPYLNDPSGKVAVVEITGCTFASKLARAEAAGALAVLIANNTPSAGPFSNATFQGIGGIPGMFISTAAGDAFAASPTGNIVVIDPNVTTFNPWGFVRIWDYSDPTNPVLASTFNTVNSLNDSGPPNPDGTYSAHNVIVEGDRAYLSWYSDGVLVLDISDPYNPVQIARYHGEGPEFEAQNGGIQDVWGIYKEPGSPLIYASDRNGGLYLLTLGPPTLSADVDCDGDVDIGDAQKTARSLINLDVSQEPGCPAIGSEVASLFGDVDCDNDVDIGDAQKIARSLINLTVTQEPGCPPIG